MLTRRRFLTSSSLAVTGGMLAPRLSPLRANRARAQLVGAQGISLPAQSAAPLGHFFEPITDAATMRALATTALDAARQAGAEWADIRLGDRRTYGDTAVTYGFGLRVRVNGIEAFVGGGDPTTDHVVRAVRSAVATARGLAQAMTAAGVPPTSTAGLTAVPVVTGEWRAPFEIDPFAVSVDEYDHLMESLSGMDDVRLDRDRLGIRRALAFSVRAETRVTANTEGSLLTQYLTEAMIEGDTIDTWNQRLHRPEERLFLPLGGIRSRTGGFEVLAQLNRFDHLETRAHELLRYMALPEGTVDVGRYNVVFDGTAHAAVIYAALGQALSLRRVLGEEADIGGTSPWQPIEAVLDQPLFSPLFSLHVEHNPPVLGACRWDAEGAPALGGPLIQQGIVVNYVTSRATHATLATLLRGRGVPPLLGSTTAMHATAQPAECPAALVVPPATAGDSHDSSLESLLRQMGSGLLVYGGRVWMNPEGTGGSITPPWMLLEVKGGQIVRRINGATLQFGTKKLFKALKGLGNISTVGEHVGRNMTGFPWSRADTSVTAPAALYTGIDVVTPQ